MLLPGFERDIWRPPSPILLASRPHPPKLGDGRETADCSTDLEAVRTELNDLRAGGKQLKRAQPKPKLWRTVRIEVEFAENTLGALTSSCRGMAL